MKEKLRSINGVENAEMNGFQQILAYKEDITFFSQVNDRLGREIRSLQKQLGADDFTRDLITSQAKREAMSNDYRMISMVFKHHNHLEPTMLAFDNKLKGFKKVFKSFDQNAEQSKAELKTMMESNKKFRERLAKKEAQLQEILSIYYYIQNNQATGQWASTVCLKKWICSMTTKHW